MAAGPDPIYVLARTVLLDALGSQRNAVIWSAHRPSIHTSAMPTSPSPDSRPTVISLVN